MKDTNENTRTRNVKSREHTINDTMINTQDSSECKQDNTRNNIPDSKERKQDKTRNNIQDQNSLLEYCRATTNYDRKNKLL